MTLREALDASLCNGHPTPCSCCVDAREMVRCYGHPSPHACMCSGSPPEEQCECAFCVVVLAGQGSN